MREHAMQRNAQQDRAVSNWLTITETAADPRLRVSPGQVRRLIEAGELDAMDVSVPDAKIRRWRVDPASVDAMVKRRTRKAA
jgi:hypothetical protein